MSNNGISAKSRTVDASKSSGFRSGRFEVERSVFGSKSKLNFGGVISVIWAGAVSLYSFKSPIINVMQYTFQCRK